LTFAQVELQDSLHRFEYDSTEWVLMQSVIYEYPSTHITNIYTYDANSSGYRFPLSKTTTNYNDNGDVIERLYYIYDPLIKDYRLTERDDLVRDANFNLLGYYSYQIDPISGEELKAYGTEYDAYDMFGNPQFRRFLYGTPSNIWEITSEEIANYFYNPLDQIDSISYVGGSSVTATAYDYNQDNLRSESRRYSPDVTSLNVQYLYEYNEDYQLSLRTFNLYDWEVEEVVPYSRLIFTYDDDKNLFCLVTERFDSKDFYLDRKTQYFYSGLTDVLTLEEEKFTIEWNNSGSGKLNISIDGLNDNENYRIGIFNMQGQQVKSLQVSNQGSWNNSYALESGSYFLVIRDRANRGQTAKMVVVR